METVAMQCAQTWRTLMCCRRAPYNLYKRRVVVVVVAVMITPTTFPFPDAMEIHQYTVAREQISISSPFLFNTFSNT